MQLKNNVCEGEQLDDLLLDGRKIIQNKNLYMFTSDSVLLSKFISVRQKDIACELCSGSGIIGILVCLEQKLQNLTMVEVQEKLANMCDRSILLNGLEKNIKVINDRLQGINKILGNEKFDVVFCNPPFEKNVIKIENESQIIARSEKLVNICEICQEASKLLKFGGKFFCCFPSTRLFELANELNKNNLAIKNLEILQDKKGNARLVLLKAVKGAKQDCLIKSICK